jgi:hypothetical protein
VLGSVACEVVNAYHRPVVLFWARQRPAGPPETASPSSSGVRSARPAVQDGRDDTPCLLGFIGADGEGAVAARHIEQDPT